jgi:hypothetical protein
VVDIEGCSCEVEKGANVTIEQGLTLIKNEVVVHPNGTLTFENNASLIQINDTPSLKFRNITYQRTSGDVTKTDYVYWSATGCQATLKEIQLGTLYLV